MSFLIKVSGIYAHQHYRNRFSALEIEDVDEDFELTPTQVALATTQSSKKVKTVDVYELEEDVTLQAAFAIFCFFEDLHRMREMIKQVWTDCSADRMSLVSASIVTQAAIQMIQRAEQELLPTCFASRPNKNSYEPLASMLVHAEIISNGTNPMSKDAVDMTPFDSFILLPTARTLFKFSGMTVGRKISWPLSIPPLRFHYLLDPEKADRPEDRKLQQDDRILCQLLQDFCLFDDVTAGMHNSKRKSTSTSKSLDPIQEDMFVKILRPVWTTGELSAAIIISARLMLDIIEVSQEKLPRFHKQLESARHYASESFKFKNVNGVVSTGDMNWPNTATNFATANYMLLKDLEMPRGPLIKKYMMQSCSG